jgi:3-oxoacyl-[acyl-carrier protein] reductase
MAEVMQQRVALITGATSGIGQAVARRLASAGHKLVLNFFNSHESAIALRDELRSTTDVLLARADVANSREVYAMVADALHSFGRLDYLVNNASFSRPDLWRIDPASIDDASWSQSLAVDLTGTFNCCRAVIPSMRRQGGSSIVNLSSAGTERGDTDTLAYNPAKAGVNGLTRVLARALAPAIRVNAVAPGSIDTGWTARWNIPDNDIAAFQSLCTGARRFGMPDEVAQIINFLLTDHSSYITGQIIAIDGGVNI